MRKYLITYAITLLPLVAPGCSDDEEDDVDTAVNPVQPGQQPGLSFFVTSTGSGEDGGNIGGLAGADAKCQDLAEAVGAGSQTWRAYLSTSTENARDRIGSGPWFNAAGEQVAADVDGLHANGLSNGDPQHMLDENGDTVPGPEHDILTGSNDDGELFLDDAGVAHTCDDWTSSSSDAAAVPGPHVGHSDIPANPMFSPSWNNAHNAPACDAASLASVGGAGRLYCFAE